MYNIIIIKYNYNHTNNDYTYNIKQSVIKQIEKRK